MYIIKVKKRMSRRALACIYSGAFATSRRRCCPAANAFTGAVHDVPGGAGATTTLVAFSSALCNQRRGFRKELFEGPLDMKAGERTARKGPPVAHSLPVYKTAHKLNSSVRWKNANLIANVAGGKDYRLRETQGEGTFDESGMYRDWLYGDERRYANYIGVSLALLSITLFLYTMRIMGTETWDIPAPVLASQRKKAAAAAAKAESEAAAVTEKKDTGEGNFENVAANDRLHAVDALAMLKKPVVLTKAT